jgi:hypothetical protein
MQVLKILDLNVLERLEKKYTGAAVYIGDPGPGLAAMVGHPYR